jgi:hypothetical protein
MLREVFGEGLHAVVGLREAPLLGERAALPEEGLELVGVEIEQASLWHQIFSLVMTS